MSIIRFNAPVIAGSGRGKDLGVATMNLDLSAVPTTMKEGIYACFAMIDGKRMKAAMHFGPRPVFQDTTSCEVHIIDDVIPVAPETLAVDVISYLRPVAAFASKDALMAQIADDIAKARGI